MLTEKWLCGRTWVTARPSRQVTRWCSPSVREPGAQAGRLSEDDDDAIETFLPPAAAARGRCPRDRVLRSSRARHDCARRIHCAWRDRHARQTSRAQCDRHAATRRYGGDLRYRPGRPYVPGRSCIPRVPPPPARRCRGAGSLAKRRGDGQRPDRDQRSLLPSAQAGQLPACRRDPACLPQLPTRAGLRRIKGGNPRRHQLRHRIPASFEVSLRARNASQPHNRTMSDRRCERARVPRVEAQARCSAEFWHPTRQAHRARTTRLTQRGNRPLQRTVQAPVMTTLRWLGAQARWLLPAVGLVLMSASCGVRSAATDSTQPSGSTALIFGVVEASPGCPVERQDHACEPRPLGDVRVEARSFPGGVTASTRTRADGHYSFRLGQGRYVLVAVTRQVVPRCPRVLVSVTSPASVRANINCDSGIR